MSRPLRIEFEGALYHVTSRGNAKQAIFLDEDDFANFLDILCLVVKRYNFILHAYCLMTNHYHLLIETPDGNLSKGMRQLNGVYTQRFNARHNKVGHLLQGRYKSIVVDKDNYLLELCRYIVLNPLRANMVEKLEDWRWSSYMACAGYEKGLDCLATNWILSQFGSTIAQATANYRDFVLAGISKESPWEKLKGQIYLGNDKFIEQIKAFMRGKETIKEIPKTQRYIARPPLEKVLNLIQNKEAREKAVYEAHVQYGYTIKEIAEFLGLHYTTVSKIVKKAEEKM